MIEEKQTYLYDGIFAEGPGYEGSFGTIRVISMSVDLEEISRVTLMQETWQELIRYGMANGFRLPKELRRDEH